MVMPSLKLLILFMLIFGHLVLVYILC
ncbi:hypothetical protein BLA29_010776 [Euroglyphus maynei]|uniref:Uncharacterized protein n=1 Tax=Euroglyphus maynei TaxID=6958 RepID=A0A1Y3BJ87_EURMA|nr:hypothetical protein BLA29_010776 [Euroglyphus maynei]